MGNFVVDSIMYGVWILTVFIFHWCTVAVKYYKVITSWFKTKVSSAVEFVRQVRQLPKNPGHVALTFQYDDDQLPDADNFDDLKKPKLDLKSVAKVTAWIAGAGVKQISLYDNLGILKLKHELLHEEICKAIGEFTGDKMPNVICHQKWAGSDCFGAPGDIHVYLKSRCDGKPKLVNFLTDIQTKEYSLSGETVKETDVNEYLFKPCCKNLQGIDIKGEPDLMMMFGVTKATLDFPPWHIRLTELHWLPSLADVQLNDVLGSLYKFANCEMRFGK